MRTLREIGEFVGIPEDSAELGSPKPIGLQLVGDLVAPVSSREQRTSMRGLIDLLARLPPITLTAELLSGARGTEPYTLAVRVNSSDGLVISTRLYYTSGGQTYVGGVIHGAAGGEIQTQLSPGRWQVTVRRSGIANTGYVRLEKSFTVDVNARGGPPPVQPEVVRPIIEVQPSGSADGVTFTIKGSGFLADQPTSPDGIAVRAVDGVTLQQYHRVFTGSNSRGEIEVVWGTLNPALLARNALGQALIHFSATDSRRDPTSPAGDFLWSNTVTIYL